MLDRCSADARAVVHQAQEHARHLALGVVAADSGIRPGPAILSRVAAS
jgi:hypothetical protein